MRESKFIEKNREKWAEFEKNLGSKKVDEDHLDDLFMQITDDLSYSRTFYPNRAIRLYLNRLAQRIFNNIYRGERLSFARLTGFWKEELPAVLWESRGLLWLSFCLFALAFGIGVLSSRIYPDFARVILGDGYINMTLENIEKGDPMAVYKDSGPFGMTVGIALNNLFVALRTFVLGVLATVGTVFIMLYNGIMVGAFQYFFIQQNTFWPSFLAIWIHGVPEISAIIIAGAAGMEAGSGLLFPGTYTRIQAFQLSVRRGFKIFLGIVPLILWAAFLEGFFTRHTEVSDLLRGAFITASLGMVLAFYVWYPRYKARLRAGTSAKAVRVLPPTASSVLDFTSIKTSGEAFAESFLLLRRYGGLLWGGVGVLSLVFCLLYSLEHEVVEPPFTWDSTSWIRAWFYPIFNFFDPDLWELLPFLQTFLLTVLTALGLRAVERAYMASSTSAAETMADRQRPTGWLRSVVLLLPVFPCVYLWGSVAPWFGWLLSWMLLPFCLLWAAVLYFETSNPLTAFGRSWQLYRYGASTGLGLLAVHFGMLLLVALMSPLWTMVLQLFSWWIPAGDDHIAKYQQYATTLAAAFVLYFGFLLTTLAMGLLYFSHREVADATVLTDKIQEVGNTPRIRGLQKE